MNCKTCYKQRTPVQRPFALARFHFVSQRNGTGRPGLAPSPHRGGCQAQAPPWLLICRQGSPVTFWLARLPPLFVRQLYQLGGWCVQAQVLPLIDKHGQVPSPAALTQARSALVLQEACMHYLTPGHLGSRASQARGLGAGGRERSCLQEPRRQVSLPRITPTFPAQALSHTPLCLGDDSSPET